jgi:hypothetical protein
MTSPLPPGKTATQVASTSTPSKLDQRAAEQKAADRQASHSDRALSPVYPANPGGAKPEVRMVYPPTNATTGAASSQEQAPAKPAPAERTATQEQAPAKPAPAERTATKEPDAAPAEAQHPQPPEPPRTTPNPAAQAAEASSATKAGAEKNDNNAGQAIAMARPETSAKDESRASAPAANEPSSAPVAQATANRCAIQACAAAYSSFRASDCTYQPFSGPRRVCDAPPGMQRNAQRGQSRFSDNARLERATRQARRDAELRDVVRSVREMRIPDERAMADDADDEPAYGGRRVIIIRRGGGFWR